MKSKCLPGDSKRFIHFIERLGEKALFRIEVLMDSKLGTIMVTGGAGCIGMQVCQQLRQRGFKVVLFDLPEQINRVVAFIPSDISLYYGSILDSALVRDAMSGCDIVIHLAGYLGVRRTEMNKLRCLDINYLGTQKVLDCAVQSRVGKIVYASSSEVYGEPLKNPVKESDQIAASSVYSASKLGGEWLCRAYSERFPDLQHTILRYFNIYGTFQTTQFVLPKFIHNVKNDISPVVFGHGNQVRSFCHADDAALLTIEAALNDSANNEVINIGNSKASCSMLDLANLVIDASGKKRTLQPVIKNDFHEADRDEKREIFERSCDTAKAESLLGEKAKVDLSCGIERVYHEGLLFERWCSSDIQYEII